MNRSTSPTQSHTDFPATATRSNSIAYPTRGNDTTSGNDVTLPVDEHREKSTFHDEVPDGGFAAWLVVLGAWCTSFCSFGWVNSIGVFQEYYQNDLLRDLSPSTVAWIPSLQIFFLLGMGPIAGGIYDNYGPRWLLLVGSFLHVFGIMMASIAKEYYQLLLAQGLCSGIGISTLFQTSVTCAAGWFSRKSGTALGILFTGSSVGGVVFPIMVSHLIPKLGYGWAMRICAFVILGLLIIANLTVRPFKPPRPRKVTREQLLKPLKETGFLLIIGCFFLFPFGYFVPLNFLPTQALDAGMDSNLAQYLVPIFNASSLFGRLSCGFLGDMIGRFNTFAAACYLSGIWVLALWLPATGDAAIIAFAILFGFSSAPFAALATPLVVQISPMNEVGYRTGLLFLSAAISGLVSNPLGGAMLGTASGWDGLMVFCGVLCLSGGTFVAAARIRARGWKLALY